MTHLDRLVPKDVYADIGKRIAAARLASGMTQEELGKAISLSRTSITNIEGGRQKILVHTLFHIATVLHVDVRELLSQPLETTTPIAEEKSLGKLDQAERAFIEQTMRSATKEKPS